MNDLQPTKLMKNSIIQFLIILFLIALIAIGLREFIRTVIITPLLYTFWIAYIVLSSVPQSVWWGCFIVLVIILVLRNFPNIRGPRTSGPTAIQPTLGKVSEWSYRLTRGSQSQYSEWQLARQVGKLSLDVLAQQEDQTVNQLKQAIAQDELPLPDKVRAYLRVGFSNFNPFIEPRWRTWWHTIRSGRFYENNALYNRFFSTQTQPLTSAIPDVENILTFLEESQTYAQKDIVYDPSTPAGPNRDPTSDKGTASD